LDLERLGEVREQKLQGSGFWSETKLETRLMAIGVQIDNALAERPKVGGVDLVSDIENELDRGKLS
jgi:hypothetical protein